MVLGKDFAGTVEAVGEGVTRFTAGDAVFGVVTKSFLGDGAFAEYVTVLDEVGIAALPDGADPVAAGALGLAGTAAADALAAAAPQAGETVLVSGATGGVGAIAVQYAAAAGARVIATARPCDEANFVRGLGANVMVDYTGDVSAQVGELSPDGVDESFRAGCGEVGVAVVAGVEQGDADGGVVAAGVGSAAACAVCIIGMAWVVSAGLLLMLRPMMRWSSVTAAWAL